VSEPTAEILLNARFRDIAKRVRSEPDGIRMCDGATANHAVLEVRDAL
jgi:hypothetical protein